MKITKKLQTKVLLIMSVTLLIVFLFLGLFIGINNRNYAVNKSKEYTRLTAEKYARQIETVLNGAIGHVKNVSYLAGTQFSNELIAPELLGNFLKSEIQSRADIEMVYISLNSSLLDQDPYGARMVTFSVDASNMNQVLVNTDNAILNQPSLLSVSEPYKKDSRFLLDISAPVSYGGVVKGYFGVTLNLAQANDLTKKNHFVPNELISVISNKGLIVFHTNSDLIGRKVSEVYAKQELDWSIERAIANGQSLPIEAVFNGEKCFSYFEPVAIEVNGIPWSVEVTVQKDVMLASSKASIRKSSLVAFLGLLLLIIVVWLVTKNIVKSISEVTRNLEFLSRGNTRDVKDLKFKSVEELEQMNESLNKVISGLRVTESFALGIGKGNLQENYELISADDQLGAALLSMRDSLKHSQEEEEKRKREEEIRNWSTHGIAMFGDILRQDSNQMKKLGYNITSNLVNYLDVNQGAFFVVNDEQEEDVFYELVTAIAYGRDKFMNKEIRIGEGLVGRCVFERKTIFLTEVPTDYANITSGLGTANPTCILIVPCILNDQVYGVIEIASFRVLKSHEIAFVEKLGESIAATISNVKVSEKTSRLLKASQHQSEELAAQEEELRQNLEEMEATQEDLKRQMETNEQMRINMRKQNALLDALMTSLPDYIYFKDRDSKFLRVSLSMIDLFGATSADELIGKSDFDFHNVANAQKYYEDEQTIIRNKKGITNQLQKEIMADGTHKWMSVTKLPLLTAEGDCIGTFGISKDVSEYKNLEIEANLKNEEVQKALEAMRATQNDLKLQEEINSKMRANELRQNALLDALLNSLPDFIYFKDEESRFIRISKSLIALFGAKTVDDVVGKSDFDYHTPENARKFFDDEKKIMESRKGIVDQLQEEIMPDGSSKWVNVTKLPLVTDGGDCIGTFGISKDVTNLKKLEISAHKREEELRGLIDAIKASTLTVEYDTNGIVIDANQAILDLLKIEKEAIMGTSHKESVEMAAVSEKDYKAFWNDLRKGIIRREKTKVTIHKNEVLLSETYTPIMDSAGKVVKVLKIAFDITSQLK